MPGRAMLESQLPRKARFQVGDRVKTVGPSVSHRDDNVGVVTEVLGSAENVIYRYRVTFHDKTSYTFYGFELEPLDSETAA